MNNSRARPSDQALAVPVEPVARLGPPGFDPSREAAPWHRYRGDPVLRCPLPRSYYDVLVVDPPWAYGSDTGRPNRVAEAHYKTIGHEGKEINRRTGKGIDNIIASVPIAAWAAPQSHLYLWTTNPKLPFAFAVMEAWGFSYMTTLTWVKTRIDGGLHGGGKGFYFRGATEHVLFGTKGRKGIPSELRRPNVILAPPTGHSAKPDAFYDLLNGVYGDANKLDVFARKYRGGWDSFGDELPEAA